MPNASELIRRATRLHMLAKQGVLANSGRTAQPAGPATFVSAQAPYAPEPFKVKSGLYQQLMKKHDMVKPRY